MPSLLIPALIGAALLFSFLGGSRDTREEDEEIDYEPPSTPRDVVDAIHDVLVESANPREREKLKKLLLEKLTFENEDGTYQILIPVNLPKTPSYDRINQIAMTIAVHYRVPTVVRLIDVKRVPMAQITVGSEIPADPILSSFGRHLSSSPSRFGGILDLVVNTIIASSVGTATSMGTQSLIHSMGGEKRLARIVRKYRKAEARGDESEMEQIRQKMTRTASRLQGRKVSWSEIEGLTGIKAK